MVCVCAPFRSKETADSPAAKKLKVLVQRGHAEIPGRVSANELAAELVTFPALIEPQTFQVRSRRVAFLESFRSHFPDLAAHFVAPKDRASLLLPGFQCIEARLILPLRPVCCHMQLRFPAKMPISSSQIRDIIL
jgi:hypothetical protein